MRVGSHISSKFPLSNDFPAIQAYHVFIKRSGKPLINGYVTLTYHIYTVNINILILYYMFYNMKHNLDVFSNTR
jgi:hypothetical protein